VVASTSLFMVYFAGPVTLADAARTLTSARLHIVESEGDLEVRSAPGAEPMFPQR
jgi:hypothetical protein